MRYYRNIRPDEPLQVSDERLLYSERKWVPVQAAWVGRTASADWLEWYYRRPVDLPVLQPVTPRAIEALEGEEICTICVLSQGYAKKIGRAHV